MFLGRNSVAKKEMKVTLRSTISRNSKGRAWSVNLPVGDQASDNGMPTLCETQPVGGNVLVRPTSCCLDRMIVCGNKVGIVGIRLLSAYIPGGAWHVDREWASARCLLKMGCTPSGNSLTMYAAFFLLVHFGIGHRSLCRHNPSELSFCLNLTSLVLGKIG